MSKIGLKTRAYRITGLVVLAGAAALAAAGPAVSQETMTRPGMPGPEATIYRDAAYNGPAVYVNGARPNLGLVWRVNSIRVKSGSWQLCERPNYQGRCVTFQRDTPMIRLNQGEVFQSMRPLNGTPGPGPAPGGQGPSLRGMAAEFFTAPARGGQRVLACSRGNATANCAAQTADQFCRSAGWTASAREAMQTVNRRVYLADVLCTRTGH